MKKIFAQLAEIENLKQFSHKNAPEISEANIGWHLEHSLLVISRILEGLPLSYPEKYQIYFSGEFDYGSRSGKGIDSKSTQYGKFS